MKRRWALIWGGNRGTFFVYLMVSPRLARYNEATR
jgi:hypothetical protein